MGRSEDRKMGGWEDRRIGGWEPQPIPSHDGPSLEMPD
jgi:hypothetical protein